MKIFIDAGHGGESIGASYKGRLEQDDCLRLALAVRDKLLTQKGVEVMLSREDSTDPDLLKRCERANSWGADYFISLHRNAFTPEGASGVEAWVFSGVETDGVTYNKAKAVVEAVCAVTGLRNRGVKKGAPEYRDFAVNSYSEMHSCLLEAGFIDNTKDNEVFDKKFSEIVRAIAKSLVEANGGKWAEPSVKEEEKASQKKEDAVSPSLIYCVQVGAYKKKSNAEAMAEKIRKAGFDAVITVKGDMDGDGRLTAEDSRLTLRASTGLEG